MLALCLLGAVVRLSGAFKPPNMEIRTLPVAIALPIGALLGYVSGLIGIGGGILLSPVLLLGRWADAKTTAAVSAAFITVNSASGLLAVHDQGVALQPDTLTWLIAALSGGLLGSWIGARRLNDLWLRRTLGGVLLLASVKLWWA